MKFNKDTFLNQITTRVQSAIDKGLISREDIDRNDTERLHSFIQFELFEYIEDRKFAIDVLKDFNYDEKTPWEKLEEEYGKFKSLMDIALVNLWKYLQSEKVTEYSYYNKDNTQVGKPMLDIAHEEEDDQNGDNPQTVEQNFQGGGLDLPGEPTGEDMPERPRRRIKIERPA